MAARFRLNTFCLVWIFLAVPAWAYNTYYVAKTGSDSNACEQAKSTSTPRLTVNAGRLCLASGDTLSIRNGTYSEPAFGYTGRLIPSGVDDAHHTIIEGYGTEYPVLALSYYDASNQILQIYGTYITVRHLKIDGRHSGNPAVNIRGTSSSTHHLLFDQIEVYSSLASNHGGLYCNDQTGGYITVTNSSFHDVGETGISGHGLYGGCGGNWIVDGITIYNARNHPLMQFYHSGEIPTNNTLRNSFLYNSPNGGGLAINASNSLIYNNIFHDFYEATGVVNYGVEILATGSTTGNKIYNNTFYNDTSNGTGVLILSGSSNNEVRNNIFYHVATAISDSGTGTIQSNNLQPSQNPRFTDAASNDFTLQAGSPAIETGYDLSAIFTTDYDGSTRANGTSTGTHFEIGAFEFESPPASLSLTYPNASGITWQNGNTYTVTWTSNGNPGNVDIDLSLDGKGTWPISIASNTADDGNQNWTVSGSNSSNCYIRIKDHATGSVIDYSDAPFTIQSSVTASITVTSPATGKVLHPGRTSPITWTAVGVSGNVKIELSLNGGTTYPVTISASTPWDYVDYTWTIPILMATSNCKIKVTSLADTNIYGTTGALRLAGKYR